MKLRSSGATKLLGAAVLVLLAGLGWLLVLGPETRALADMRAQIDTTRAQNDLLRQQLAGLQKQQEELPRTRAFAGALAEKFPPTADQPGLFRAVTLAASNAGIGARDVTALTPTAPSVGAVDEAAGVQLEEPASANRLAKQSVSVSVEGTYDETQRLLENFEQMPRAYLITTVTLAAGAGNSIFTTTVTGDMFVMPPAEDPAQAARSSPSKPD